MTSLQPISWGNLPAGIGSEILDCCDLESAMALTKASKGNYGLRNTKCFLKVILRDYGEHVVDIRTLTIAQLKQRVSFVQYEFGVFSEIVAKVMFLRNNTKCKLSLYDREGETNYLSVRGFVNNPKRKDYVTAFNSLRSGSPVLWKINLRALGIMKICNFSAVLSIPFDEDNIALLSYIIRKGASVKALADLIIDTNNVPIKMIFNKDFLSLWVDPNNLEAKLKFFNDLEVNFVTANKPNLLYANNPNNEIINYIISVLEIEPYL